VRSGGGWAYRPSPRPDAQLRLVCLPHAGGGAAAFNGWAEFLPADVELVAVRLPGRESRIREPAIRAWPDLLDALLSGLKDVFSRPFALLGHSLGAMTAFELTERLTALGTSPRALVLAGCRAPHVPRLVPAIRDLADEEFLGHVRRFSGTPDDVLSDPRILGLLGPMLRADMALAETWPPGPPHRLQVPLVTYAGADDPMAPPDTVAAWREYAPAGFSTRVLPGGHFFVASEAEAFLASLGPDLAAWCGDGPVTGGRP
jgi:medium-chain acyl-[acyl-carrier-protein] hydrolase